MYIYFCLGKLQLCLSMLLCAWVQSSLKTQLGDVKSVTSTKCPMNVSLVLIHCL